jgi:hypothetical protein
MATTIETAPAASRPPHAGERRPIPELIEGPPVECQGLRVAALAAGTRYEYWAGLSVRRLVEGAHEERRWFTTPAFAHPADALEYAMAEAMRLLKPSTAARPRRPAPNVPAL